MLLPNTENQTLNSQLQIDKMNIHQATSANKFNDRVQFSFFFFFWILNIEYLPSIHILFFSEILIFNYRIMYTYFITHSLFHPLNSFNPWLCLIKFCTRKNNNNNYYYGYPSRSSFGVCTKWNHRMWDYKGKWGTYKISNNDPEKAL